MFKLFSFSCTGLQFFLYLTSVSFENPETEIGEHEKFVGCIQCREFTWWVAKQDVITEWKHAKTLREIRVNASDQNMRVKCTCNSGSETFNKTQEDTSSFDWTDEQKEIEESK